MADKIVTPNDFSVLNARLLDVSERWYAGLEQVGEPEPPPPPTPGQTWLTGPADGADIITTWQGLTGKPATYARIWADSGTAMENMYGLSELGIRGYSGVLDLCVGGPSDWANAANGNYDSFWRKQCQTIHRLFGTLKRLDLSMAHEFNNGYPWKVTSANQFSFRIAWERWYKIVQQELVEKGRNVKVVLPFNSDTNGGFTLAGGLPPLNTFDIVGCDFYNMWPALPNQAIWDANKNSYKTDVPRGIDAWITWAKEVVKKPIQFGEWGQAPGGNFLVDDPFYVRAMFETFKRIAPADPYNPGPGELAGEAYFNNYAARGMMFPVSTSVPKSVLVYKELWR